MVKSMLSYSSLPFSLWMQASKIILYLLNRVPSKTISKTSFELWMRRKLNLRNMHVWGCSTEVRIYNSHKKKVDSRTTNDFFIGYLGKFKGYGFYYLDHSMRMVEIGNTRFLENDNIGRSMEPHKVEIEEVTYNFFYCFYSC